MTPLITGQSFTYEQCVHWRNRVISYDISHRYFLNVNKQLWNKDRSIIGALTHTHTHTHTLREVKRLTWECVEQEHDWDPRLHPCRSFILWHSKANANIPHPETQYSSLSVRARVSSDVFSSRGGATCQQPIREQWETRTRPSRRGAAALLLFR